VRVHPTQAHGPFTHVAVPYGTDQEYLAVVLPQVRAALAKGEDVLVVTGPRNLALLRHGLGRDAAAVDTGLAEHWYDHPARSMTALADYAGRRGGRRVLIVGEPRWQHLTERETREWIRREVACNLALASVNATGLCLFDRRATPPAVLAAMRRAHPYALGPAGAPRRNDGYVPPEAMLREAPLADDDKPFDDPPAGSEAIEFGLATLKRLRDFVATRARRAGMSPDRVSALILCVAELAANAVEHGGGHGRASIWEHDGEIVCEIGDTGGGLTDRLPGYLPPPEGSARGYGLWLTRQTCDLMEIRTDRGGTRIRVHMRLR
jgi:Anti-sigma regulatory factor (Ser/Thr protein kinase)